MRYKCQRCEQWIKDKFIFGLMHLCLTDEEYAHKQQMHSQLAAQQKNLGNLTQDFFDKYKEQIKQDWKRNE